MLMRFAMPSAKHRIMVRIPDLSIPVSNYRAVRSSTILDSFQCLSGCPGAIAHSCNIASRLTFHDHLPYVFSQVLARTIYLEVAADRKIWGN